ncbi:MAG: hypothetical protein ACI4I6_00645 [Hominimerdicola sp.]
MKLKLAKTILSSMVATVIMSVTVSVPVLADNSSNIDYTKTTTSFISKNETVPNVTNSSIQNFYTHNIYYSSSSSSSSNKNNYYYNTGTSCPKKASYGKHYKIPNTNHYTRSLLKSVKKGDIIYEAAGGFGITGHIAIVEGKFY